MQSAWAAAVKAINVPKRTGPEPTRTSAGAAPAKKKGGPLRSARREPHQEQVHGQKQRNAPSGPSR